MMSDETASVVFLVDTVVVVTIGLIGALLSEGISWFVVYRRGKYQQLLDDINRSTKKINKHKKTAEKSAKSSQWLKAQEQQLQTKTQNLNLLKMAAQLLSSLVYFLIIPVFTGYEYNGYDILHYYYSLLFWYQSLQWIGGSWAPVWTQVRLS